MMTTVVNETTPGKSWLVFWELGSSPDRTDDYTLTADATFTCGQKVYKVEFVLSIKKWWDLELKFETTKGNEKVNDQEFKVCRTFYSFR